MPYARQEPEKPIYWIRYHQCLGYTCFQPVIIEFEGRNVYRCANSIAGCPPDPHHDPSLVRDRRLAGWCTTR